MGTQGEKTKRYRAVKDPLDGSFLNGAFYRCHLESQHPGHRDQEIRNRGSYDSSTLSSHTIAYPSSSTRGSHDDMGKTLTSFINGISNAFETNPGTSFDTVTSLSHATANARARDNVSSDVCNAEINSTSFCKFGFGPPFQLELFDSPSRGQG
jgi:hypothetical protein